jgi:hypothetical protein
MTPGRVACLTGLWYCILCVELVLFPAFSCFHLRFLSVVTRLICMLDIHCYKLAGARFIVFLLVHVCSVFMVFTAMTCSVCGFWVVISRSVLRPRFRWVHQFMTLHISLLLVFSVQYTYFFININLFNCSCSCICLVFIVCGVSFIACVVLCAVFV